MPANTIQYAHAESKILIIQPPDWNQPKGYSAEIRVFLGPGTESLPATAETIPGGRAFIRCESLFNSGPKGGIPLPLEIGDIVDFALEGADVRVLAVKKEQSIVEPTASFTDMPKANISPARFNNQFIYISPKFWPHHSKARGSLRIILPDGSIVNSSFTTVGSGHGELRGHGLYGGKPRGGLPLPLQLGDEVEYGIVGADIRILAIHRGGGSAVSAPVHPVTPSPPPVILPTAAPAHPVAPGSLPLDLCAERARRFIEFLRAVTRRRPVNLDIPEDWASGAHTAAAGAGNPSGSQVGLSERGTANLVSIFRDLVSSLSDELVAGQSGFDRAFFDALSQCLRRANPLEDTTLYSFGRAQKFLTISLKYCYAWRLIGKTESPLYGNIEWVDRWAPFLHVPVDQITLDHIRTFDVYRHIALIGPSANLSWKWYLTEPRYCRVQDAIRALSAAKQMNPMDYEMENIWVAADADE